MAEPAEQFSFDVPALDAPVLSEEIRNNFNSLGRTLFTEDDTLPAVAVARDGMMRVNASDPTNIKLDVFLSGAWRTILQGLAGGISATTKIIASFVSASVWTIDHNLGTKPLAQVADANNMQLEPVSPLPEPITIASLSALDLAGVPPGPPFPVRSGILLPFNGSIVATQGIVVVPPAGPPTFAIDFAIGGVPITGGSVVVPAAAPPGPIPGTPVTGGNVFSLITPLDVLITTAAPIGAGAVDVVLDMLRTPRPGQYTLEHATDDRVVITHPAPTTGVAILVG
jgi:hypothetical protein